MTKDEKHHMGRVAALGCIICGGLAQVHHIKTHMGGGRDHFKTIPLCARHHVGHGYSVSLHDGKKAFEAKFGTELELLEKVRKCLQNQTG